MFPRFYQIFSSKVNVDDYQINVLPLTWLTAVSCIRFVLHFVSTFSGYNLWWLSDYCCWNVALWYDGNLRIQGLCSATKKILTLFRSKISDKNFEDSCLLKSPRVGITGVGIITYELGVVVMIWIKYIFPQTFDTTSKGIDIPTHALRAI